MKLEKKTKNAKVKKHAYMFSKQLQRQENQKL